MSQRILFVTQTLGSKAACGIGLIGKLIGESLIKSEKYDFKILYTDSAKEVEEEIKTSNPKAIIYNYSSLSTPWVQNQDLRKKYSHILHLVLDHEMHQQRIDSYKPKKNFGFKYVLSPDTTLRANNGVFLVNRLIPPHKPKSSTNAGIGSPKHVMLEQCEAQVSKMQGAAKSGLREADDPTAGRRCSATQQIASLRKQGSALHVEDYPGIPIIGFQGFGPRHKGIHKIAEKVQEEFDEAIIRLHIPFSFYGDPEGKEAKSRVAEVKRIITKPGILIEASHDLLPTDKVVQFLSENTINCYFYDYLPGAGLASSPDYALAAKRPIAVTKSHQLRNFIGLSPSICIEDNSLKDIISFGLKPLEKLHQLYTEENVLRDYEEILNKLLTKQTWKTYVSRLAKAAFCR